MEVIPVKGSDLTDQQASFALEAQLWLHKKYGGPINVSESLNFTFASQYRKFVRGIVGCLIHHPWDDGTWVLTAYVVPDCQRNGILRKMLDSLEGKVMLNTRASNLYMQKAMGAIGFKQTLMQHERAGE
jgi:hypothetical protein